MCVIVSMSHPFTPESEKRIISIQYWTHSHIFGLSHIPLTNELLSTLSNHEFGVIFDSLAWFVITLNWGTNPHMDTCRCVFTFKYTHIRSHLYMLKHTWGHTNSQPKGYQRHVLLSLWVVFCLGWGHSTLHTQVMVSVESNCCQVQRGQLVICFDLQSLAEFLSRCYLHSRCDVLLMMLYRRNEYASLVLTLYDKLDRCDELICWKCCSERPVAVGSSISLYSLWTHSAILWLVWKKKKTSSKAAVMAYDLSFLDCVIMRCHY